MASEAATVNQVRQTSRQPVSGIRARNDDAFRDAREHSRRVKRLKIFLPAVAIVSVAVFAAYSGLSGESGFSANLDGSGIEDGKLVMANPKLDGFTKEKLPYTMTAVRAIQDISDTNIIELESIDASIPVDAKTTAKIDAESGIYDNSDNTLDINSPVTVTTNDGMIAKLKSAYIDMGSGNLKTEKPVDIERNGSRILADSMTITDRGKIMVFQDRVRLTILPEQLKTPRNGEEAAQNAN